MCGIAGYLNFNGEPASAVILKKMARAIAHRGPDSEGVYAARQWGLSHRRLSIIDLSPAGNQPMSSADERFILTYNGEIYNYKELKKEYHLKNDEICLSGFSQGCMMSINIGLTSEEKFNCIVGFSGKIINQENLKIRKKNSTDTLLIHGDSDQVVSPSFMLEAKDFFIRNNVQIDTHLIKNCDHHIPIEASSLALNYISKRI